MLENRTGAMLRIRRDGSWTVRRQSRRKDCTSIEAALQLSARTRESQTTGHALYYARQLGIQGNFSSYEINYVTQLISEIDRKVKRTLY